MIAQRFPNRSSTFSSSRPSRQRAGSYSRALFWIVSVGGILLLASLRSLTTTPNYSRPLLFNFDEEDEEDANEEVDFHPNIRLQSASQNSTEFGPVIHIIQTRFMQFQSNLTELGLARVLLFETFSLPTLLRQSSQNYFWIIRTDPLLNDAVRQKFIASVKPYSNIYVIASNGNPGGFRSSTYMADIQEDTVWNGDYHKLLRAHEASQTRLVLESRLDADDGLYQNFVSNLQEQAVQFLSHDKTLWKLWCSHVYLDWQLVSPWKDFDPAFGVLSVVQSPICVTPGLTVGYSVETKRSDFPGGAHHLMHQKIPPCQNGNGHVKCLSRYPRDKFSAVRARTVTSAGMDNVVLESKDTKQQQKQQDVTIRQNEQDELWVQLMNLFGITKEKATSARRTLMDKQSTLAMENLKGQCIKGFTCKDTSRNMLQHLAKTNEKKKKGETNKERKKKKEVTGGKKQKGKSMKKGQALKQLKR